MRRMAAVAVLAATLMAACSSNTSTKTTTETSGGSSATTTTAAKGAAADATVQTCEVDQFKIAHAKGQVTNHSSKASNYLLHVGFLQGTTRVAEGYGASNGVAPNQTALFDVVGSPQVTNGGTITCSFIDVSRHEA